jgi:hypothetical protein
MSSTWRSPAKEREPNDYYVTPISAIGDFIKAFQEDYPEFQPATILDPCCGGNSFIAEIINPETKEVIQEQVNEHPMSYPLALEKYSGWSGYKLGTVDVREDSFAERKESFLTMDIPIKFDLVMSNPPFRFAQEFVNKSLSVVREGGFVVMLLRLNFFGAKKRFQWWKSNMPIACYVHNDRMSFTDNKKTDSIEYMHCVWQKGVTAQYTRLKII